MRPMAPCKDCPNRCIDETYNCHTHCTAYLSFVQKNKEIKDKRAKNSMMDSVSYAAKIRMNQKKDSTYYRKKKEAEENYLTYGENPNKKRRKMKYGSL